MKRTHTCGELNASHVGTTATLIGWVDTVRDHGGICFIDLRDREGRTQFVFDPSNSEYNSQLSRIKPESVLQITGVVKPRSPETINTTMLTGTIEIEATSLVIHNIAQTPPFPLDDERAERVNEDMRLAYRYLDLRRPAMQQALRTRHLALKATREYLDDNGFTEIETPYLFKSTPEGAREFLVPSRVNPGQFYALSQSPQQLKQMLMVAGMERYYQIARCFRDEDLRADRQPEFTQIDIEVSFVEREDMYNLLEGMLARIWKVAKGVDIPLPFPRMAYHEAMNRYGVDKPDTRYGLELVELSDLFKNSGFKLFRETIANGGVIKAINAKGLADVTQGEMKNLEDSAKAMGAKGLAYIRVQNGEWKSPITKFFTEEEKSALIQLLNIEEGDIIFFAATDWEKACNILGRIRIDCAQLLVKRGRMTLNKDQFNFLWVIEFPLMLFDADEGRYVAAHHPFTAPVESDSHLLDSNPTAVRGQHYDCVLNGWEIAGGSIRIHQPELQKKIFEDVLKIPQDVVESRFGYMLKAFTYGAPPHGGIAFGVERLICLLTGRTSIRDVIAFPKNQKGQDLMAGSPSSVTAKQLRDAHITVVDVAEQPTTPPVA
ncbi:MAG: aspartate--tRNA ligase [Verrucomicrobiota bacterium]|nr:aspartate--tRNA ligase [Verrucomicrobiota bacterium]